MDKISVIIPVYNAEKYLAQCLTSVFNQSYKNLEIICINDKSTDNSEKILEDFSKKDSRITIINNKENSGSAISRNNGLDIASGKYIYFIDADDYIDEKYLEVMVNKIEKSESDIVLNLSVFCSKNGEEIPYDTFFSISKKSGEFIEKYKIIAEAPDTIWARLYKKDFLDRFNIRFENIFSDDVYFNTIAELYSDKTFVFHGEKYHYTIHRDRMTAKATKRKIWDLEHFKAYNLIFEYIRKKNLLNDKLKLFNAYPSTYSIDSEEKFVFCKMFFEKIKENFFKNRNIYSDFEKIFADSILKAKDFKDYQKNCSSMVRIFKLIDRKNNL